MSRIFLTLILFTASLAHGETYYFAADGKDSAKGTTADAPLAVNEWHELQMLQIDGKIRGVIDGKVLLEIDDSSRTNTGAILNYGHIALRCMVHTSMVFRNLKVFTERLPFTEVKARP